MITWQSIDMRALADDLHDRIQVLTQELGAIESSSASQRWIRDCSSIHRDMLSRLSEIRESALSEHYSGWNSERATEVWQLTNQEIIEAHENRHR